MEVIPINSFNLWSAVFGFNKMSMMKLMSKEYFGLMFFLLSLLQYNIWDHAYSEKYVEPYRKRQKEQNYQ